MEDTREYKSATYFIKGFLEHTNNRGDTIKVKNLYEQYIESSRNTLGKKTFNKILEAHGFSILRGNGNALIVYYIKSNWI